MSVPNVNCKLLFIENEKTLAKSPALNDKYGSKRAFYSGKQVNDYLTYVSTGAMSTLNYMDYLGDKEKSSGTFGADGLMDFNERKQLREHLRVTDSIIWDCLLSFQPEFGKVYCNEYEQAYRMMKSEMPKFLKDAGFNPHNVIWYAGLHTNKEHRHIHISFFEKEPTRYRQRHKGLQYSRGKINQSCITQFKLRVEQRLTDISAELRVARQEISAITKAILFSKKSRLNYNSEFKAKLTQLADKLPSSGRISYDSDNLRELKPLINRIVDIAIKSSPEWYIAFVKFCGETKKRDDRIRAMLIRNKVPDKYWNRYLKSDVYLDDLYRRMGNQVLNYLRVYKKKERPTRNRLAGKRMRTKTAASVIVHCMEMQAYMEKDAMYLFEEYLRKLEEIKEESTYGEAEYEQIL